MKKYESLDEFFADQEPEKLQQILLIREIILAAEPTLQETSKWNAPSYVYDGQDRITFNLMNKANRVTVLVHMGAKRKENRSGKPLLQDDGQIVEWKSDIRGAISFDGLQDVESKRVELTQVIKSWLLLEP